MTQNRALEEANDLINELVINGGKMFWEAFPKEFATIKAAILEASAKEAMLKGQLEGKQLVINQLESERWKPGDPCPSCKKKACECVTMGDGIINTMGTPINDAQPCPLSSLENPEPEIEGLETALMNAVKPSYDLHIGCPNCGEYGVTDNGEWLIWCGEKHHAEAILEAARRYQQGKP